MKRYVLKSIFLFSVLISISQISQASHTFGAEIFYRHNPLYTDSTYEFTLILNSICCQGTCCGAYISIRYQSDSLAIDSSFRVYRLPTYGTGVPPFQVQDIVSCTDSSGLCLEENVYRANWTSPARARDWIFSFEYCCRGSSYDPTYQNNLSSYYVHVESGLNNLDFPDWKSKNSSPIFHNRRPNHPGHLNDTIKNFGIKTLCGGINYTLEQDAKEYQGDSVVYSFYQPQEQWGVTSAYNSPWSFSNPMPTANGPLTINPITGVISITPKKGYPNGRFIIGVQAEEYRNDTIVSGGSFTTVPKRIGFVRRELFIFIADSGNCRKDSLHPKDIYLEAKPKNNEIAVHFHNGDPNRPNTQVRCNSISSDGTEFRVLDSSTYIPPFDTTVKSIAVLGASWNCQTGLTDEIVLTLAEPLKCGEYHLMLKKGTDLDVLQSECGFWEREFSSSKIYTGDTLNVNLGPDKEFCDTLKFLYPLDAGAGYPGYAWNTGDSTRKIYVDTFGTYIATVYNAFCEESDTVEIIALPCVDTSGSTSGISKIESGSIHIFPNPSDGVFFIERSDLNPNQRIVVYDIIGNEILRMALSGRLDRVSLINAKAGLYFVALFDENGLKESLGILVE